MGESEDSVAQMPPLARAAFFLDFDGTLVGIASTPQGIDVPADLSDMLAALREACGGAMAVVSGRPVADLRRFLPELGPPMVGGHGAEWWLDGAAPEAHPASGGPAVAAMTAAAHDLARSHPSLLVEEKLAGVVIHYRADASLRPVVEAAADEIAAAHPGFETHPAKMAVEIRPDDVGKDAAVDRLMATPPFAGRTPVFFGDDTTDEVAIAWVEARGGLGVKVGDGDSAARQRLSSPAEVLALLRSLV